ncbi:MAG: hypothetical protein RL385_1479 [Pseudomonadota bacterium]|jgi:hypothetical protein
MRHVSKFLPALLLTAHALAGCAAEIQDDGEQNSSELAAIAQAPEVKELSQELIEPTLCALMSQQANAMQGELLNQLRDSLKGRKQKAGLRKDKYMEVTDVTSASLNGCRLSMRLQVTLYRPGIRADAHGHADVSGTLYAAKERVLQAGVGWHVRDRACLRNMDTDNFDLDNTLNIGEAIFERQADKSDGDCFSPSGLWTKVENGIRDARMFGVSVPDLAYETLPQRRLNGWIFGDIATKWNKLGGDKFFGEPLDTEFPTADGVGRHQSFTNADIAWHPSTGAWVVLGAIRDKWKALGAENWGYPVTDELATPDKVGRYNHFVLPGVEDRSIYWTPQTGAVGVRGAIRTVWANQGWESGALGYPTADEGQLGPINGQQFQGGRVVWNGSNWIAER